MAIGGAIAGLAGGLYAHYTTHIEHLAFGVLQSIFALAYPIIGGLASVFGTLAAVVFVQGFLVEGLRELGDWRNLLFGILIIVAMVVRPSGFLDAMMLQRIRRLLGLERRNA
jgi:branched-chain amino acid transport system permease protein